MAAALVLVAAVARNGVIGIEGRLPWHLPADLRHFRALTMNKPLLLGRKTYESIGRPLPGRATVVVSRRPWGSAVPGAVESCATLEEALARGAALASDRGVDEIVVGGGAMLYAALIDRAERLYLTEVDLAPEGDAFFPTVDPRRWRLAGREDAEASGSDGASFAFATYARR